MNKPGKNFKTSISRILAVVLIVFAAQGAFAARYSNVAVNGLVLTVQQLQMLEWELGTVIAPGSYLFDQQGCWINLTTGASGCIQGGSGQVDTYSRYGSGERTGDGSWNHYSNSAGLGVGGTSDGCIYTTSGWSNC